MYNRKPQDEKPVFNRPVKPTAEELKSNPQAGVKYFELWQRHIQKLLSDSGDKLEELSRQERIGMNVDANAMQDQKQRYDLVLYLNDQASRALKHHERDKNDLRSINNFDELVGGHIDKFEKYEKERNAAVRARLDNVEKARADEELRDKHRRAMGFPPSSNISPPPSSSPVKPRIAEKPTRQLTDAEQAKLKQGTIEHGIETQLTFLNGQNSLATKSQMNVNRVRVDVLKATQAYVQSVSKDDLERNRRALDTLVAKKEELLKPSTKKKIFGSHYIVNETDHQIDRLIDSARELKEGQKPKVKQIEPPKLKGW